ncbi:MAG: hypothetical protein ABI193_06790 [Minicystis sp.]
MKGRGEDEMAAWLRARLRRAELDATVALRYDPKRSAEGNKTPDFIVEVEVRVPLFEGHVAVLRAPILIEVEAGAGLDGALQDLEHFVERSVDGSGRQPPAIELSFVAATGRAEGRSREVVRMLPVRFRVAELAIPERSEGEPPE